MASNILVTGGLGFIGSHVCIELIKSGYNIIIVDNLKNSKLDVLARIQEITDVTDRIIFFNDDLMNYNRLEYIFETYYIDLVIHCAGLKSVNESIKIPLLYYNENIGMTLNLLKCMSKYNCKKIIFSSSATVYGNVNSNPIKENSIIGQGITNPYGKTKYFIEEILRDLYISDNSWSIVILRYLKFLEMIMKQKMEHV